MLRHRIPFLTLALTCAVVMSSKPTSVSGQPDPGQAMRNSTDLIDLVLLLDESGSMRYNDPTKVRVAASQLFVDLLLPMDRIAVIGFGEGARLAAPLQAVGQGRDALLMRLATVGGPESDRDTSSGRFSQIREALAQAEGVLAARTERRPAAVILLTDGEFQRDDIPPAEGLQDYLDDSYGVAARLASAGTIVVSMAFTRVANLEVLSRVARSGGGFTERVERPEQTTEVFFKILRMLVPSGDERFPEGATSKEFQVPQGTWRLTVIAFKARLGSGPIPIYLERSGGGPVSGMSRDSRFYSVLNVDDPVPGTYTARVPVEGRLEVHILRRSSIRMTILRPDAGSRLVPVGSRLPIGLQVSGGVAGAVQGEAVAPDGAVSPIRAALRSTSEEEAVWEAEYLPTMPGTHRIMFGATDQTGTLTQATVLLEVRAVQSSTAGLAIENGPANVGTPFSVDIQIEPGNPLQTLSATVIKTNGKHQDLDLVEGTMPGGGRRFTAEYAETDQPGIYHVRLEAVYESEGERLVQQTEQAVYKTITVNAPKRIDLDPGEPHEAMIRIHNHGPSGDLAVGEMVVDGFSVGFAPSSSRLLENSTTELVATIRSDDPPTEPEGFLANGRLSVDGETFDVNIVLRLVRDRVTVFELVGLLLVAGLIFGGGLFLFCRVGGRFSSGLVVHVEASRMDYYLADYASGCRQRVYANADVELDSSLGPKTLVITPSGGGATGWRLREDVVDVSINGEALMAGEKRLVYPGDRVDIAGRTVTISEDSVEEPVEDLETSATKEGD